MEMMIYAILSVKNRSEKLNALLGGMKGIAGAHLIAVSYNQIAGVVSNIKRDNLVTDRSNAIEFAGVIETLGQQFTLLPMRFGSVMGSTDAIVKMLERNHPEFQQNLQKVEHKCEFGLKIFCDSEKLKAELRVKSEADTETTAKPAPEIKNSVYRDYVNKKLKEHRFEELMVNYVDSVISEITGHLTRLNTVNKIKKLTTATNIIDAVFLLDTEKEDELIRTVQDLQNKNRGLTYVLTGPWPPYNFVDCTVK